MSQFLVKTTLFIFICFAVIAGTVFITEKELSKDQYYNIDKTKKIIIMGHSHTECALNDTLIRNSINFSQSAESYFYTYLKLKKLHTANPTIKTVLLELTNNNMDNTMDEWIFGTKYIAYRYGQYSQLMVPEDKLFLFINNPKEFVAMQSPALKKKLLFFKEQTPFFDYFDWGGYIFRTSNATQNTIKNKDQFSEFLPEERAVMTSEISKKNINYLCRIAEFCRDYKIELIFIRTPLKPGYTKMHEKILKELSITEFNGIPFLDFADYKLADEDFNDMEHLSYSGSVKFSNMIDSVLTSKIYLVK